MNTLCSCAANKNVVHTFHRMEAPYLRPQIRYHSLVQEWQLINRARRIPWVMVYTAFRAHAAPWRSQRISSKHDSNHRSFTGSHPDNQSTKQRLTTHQAACNQMSSICGPAYALSERCTTGCCFISMKDSFSRDVVDAAVVVARLRILALVVLLDCSISGVLRNDATSIIHLVLPSVVVIAAGTA